MEVRRLAVVGTGLIGASAALAVKRVGKTEVIGYDLEPEAVAAAAERGAVDKKAASVGEAVGEADLAIVAAPVAPLAATEPERHRLVHGFVSSLGARPVAVDPVAHDRLVALTSHLPHALANLLVNQAGTSRIDGHEPLAAAGGSLRDMTRVAGANPRIWIDIFLDNAGPVREALGEHRKHLDRLEQALADGDAGFLAKWIGEAAGNRQRMLGDAYPDPGALQQLRVHVPDRPGVLAGITQALGAERINIEDFELLHMSPDRGGTLTVLVTGEDEARRAADLLEAQGYGVVVAPVLPDQ